MPTQGAAPVSGVFPADDALHLLEIGIQAIQLSPYHAGPAAPRFIRLSTTAAFLACCCPLHLSDPGKPSDAGTSLRVPPGCTGNTVRSTRGALPVLLPVGFPVSPPEPGVRLTAHRALHKSRGICASELMLCSARVSGSVLPGSSSAWRVLEPGRTVPRHRRRAICRSVDAAASRRCADACALAT